MAITRFLLGFFLLYDYLVFKERMILKDYSFKTKQTNSGQLHVQKGQYSLERR
jgi:hypothetical protein